MTTKKKRILLVDDDPDFKSAVRKILEKGGYAVAEARNGTEGLAMAEAEALDLILVDVVMDTFSEGFDLITRLARSEKASSIPRVIISSLALVQQMDTVHPRELGTVQIVQKPVSATDLMTVVRDAIGASAEET